MSAGLLTGAEPTLSAYIDCFVANEERADIEDPDRAFALSCWMTRQFWRSNNGRDWRLITNW